jgi:hypothetical protein
VTSDQPDPQAILNLPLAACAADSSGIDREALAEMYANTGSTRVMAESIPLAPSTIWRYLRAHGIPLGSPGRRKADA